MFDADCAGTAQQTCRAGGAASQQQLVQTRLSGWRSHRRRSSRLEDSTEIESSSRLSDAWSAEVG